MRHLVEVLAIVAPGFVSEVALVIRDVAVAKCDVEALGFPDAPVAHGAVHEDHRNSCALLCVSQADTIDFNMFQRGDRPRRRDLAG